MKFNNKFKSLLSILCLIAVLFSAFAGCDSENTYETTTEIVGTTLENQTEEYETDEATTENSEIGKTEDKKKEKETQKVNKPESVGDDNSKAVLSKIPEYSGRPYVVINDNIPSFNKYTLFFSKLFSCIETLISFSLYLKLVFFLFLLSEL